VDSVHKLVFWKRGARAAVSLAVLAVSVLVIPFTPTPTANALTAGIVATDLALNLDPNISDSYPGTGTTVTDLSGANRHGTFAGSTLPTFNNVSPKAFQFTRALVNNTASTASKITVDSKFLTDNFTIQTWIKTSQVGHSAVHYTTMFIMASECGGGANDWGFGVNNSGKLAFGAGRTETTIATPESVNTDTWVNVAASRNMSTGAIRLYINGVLKNSGNGSSGNSLTCSQDNKTWIGNGQDGTAYSFGGSIGSVLAYTKVLSDADILTNYNATSGTFYPVAPASSAVPVITGTARTGSTLAATTGSWTGSPTSWAYQWQRASTSGGSYSDIPSATSNSYVLTDSDIDKYVRVSVVATNSVGSTSVSSSATSIVVDLPDSDVPTVTTPVATATGFSFTISNYSNLYTYALTTSKGSVSRSNDGITVTGLVAGESTTVTIAVTRANYKPASKSVSGSAIPAPTTTTTAAPALSIVIQAPVTPVTPVTTVPQGQASVATVAPTTTTPVPVLSAGKGMVSTTTVAPTKSNTVVTTTLPRMVTTTTVGPPVVGKVDTGQTAVQVDGVKTDAVVSRENNQMVVTAGSLSATLSGLDKAGKTSPLDSDGNIRLTGGDVIKISVGGFKPKSVVEVWLFSKPTKLGSAVVGVDGAINGLFTIPVGINSGPHRVVISAKLANGKTTTFTLGILVGNISKTSTLTRVLIAIPIALAMGFGFLLPNQVRRRRKIRTA
jgi:hypothetical protein